MEKSFIERYKNKKQKSSQLNTVESRKTRGVMVDRPAPVETVTAASTVTSYSRDDDDSDTKSENNYSTGSYSSSSSCSDSRRTANTNAISTNNDEIEDPLYLLIKIIGIKLSVNDYDKYWLKCYKREKLAYTEERNYCFKQIIDEIERCLNKLDGETHILPVNIFRQIRPASKETQDGNDNRTFLCKRNFIRKYVKSTTISHLKDVIDKNLLFAVYYSLFTYYKFGKNSMKLKISPDRFFTIISSMLYEVSVTTLNKQLMIIIWSFLPTL